jgi:hypothetical protein
MFSANDFAGTRYDSRSYDRIISLINSCLISYPSLKCSRIRVPPIRILITITGPLPFFVGDVLYAVQIIVMLAENFPNGMPSMRITDPVVIPPSCRFLKQGGAVDLQPFFAWAPERTLVELLGYLALCLGEHAPFLIPQLRPAPDVPKPRPPAGPMIAEAAQAVIDDLLANSGVEHLCRYGLLKSATDVSEALCHQLAAANAWERQNLPSAEAQPLAIPPELARDARLTAAQEAWRQTADEIRGLLATESIDVDAALKLLRKAAMTNFTTQVLPDL